MLTRTIVSDWVVAGWQGYLGFNVYPVRTMCQSPENKILRLSHIEVHVIFYMILLNKDMTL